jgi:hypothetical protein
VDNNWRYHSKHLSRLKGQGSADTTGHPILDLLHLSSLAQPSFFGAQAERLFKVPAKPVAPNSRRPDASYCFSESHDEDSPLQPHVKVGPFAARQPWKFPAPRIKYGVPKTRPTCDSRLPPLTDAFIDEFSGGLCQ